MIYPKDQKYIIIPSNLGEKRFAEYFAVCRKSINEKLWIWNWDGRDPILKEFAEDPNCETLNHAEALEKMATHSWCIPEEEF